jgi:hypothetical protein
MANLLVTALNAGELSPYMDARTDVEKYRSGCRTLENMIVLPYGGVYRRAGTEYLGEAKNASQRCRLIGFNFSVTTTFVLELGHQYIRFWTGGAPVLSGGNPYEIASPYQESELRELQYAQVNDVMYIVHPNHAPRKLSRIANNNWTLSAISFKYPPVLDQNTGTATIASSAANGTVTLTASASTFLAGHVGSQWAIQWPRNSSSLERAINANGTTSGTLDIQGTWTLTTVGIWKGTVRLLRVPTKEMDEDGGSGFTAYEVVREFKCGDEPRNFVATGTEDERVGLKLEVADVSINNTASTITRTEFTCSVTSTGHGYQTGDQIQIPLAQAEAPIGSPNPRSITVIDANTYTYTSENPQPTAWATGVTYPEGVYVTNGGTVYYCLVTHVAGGVFATDLAANKWVAQNPITTKSNVTVTNLTKNQARVFLESTDFNSGGVVTINSVASGTSAGATVNKWLGKTITGTTQWSEAAFSAVRGYPRAVCLHEQRLCFGGTAHQPTTVWCSKVDDFENFQTSSSADSGIALTLAADEANRINWLFSQSKLMVGTSGDEWVLGSALDSEAFSATNLIARRQSGYGSKYIRAILLNDVLLFVQRRGRKLRELTYNFERDGWVAPDLTVLSEHITESEIVELAFQQQPDATFWAVRGDGKLIGMSYERDQNVVAWHRHSTEGDIESVATIYGASGADDEVWLTVRRTIGGQTKRYIERLRPDARATFDAQTKADWWYLDSAKRYSGTATTTITGLAHLNGKTVGVLADGAVQPDAVVASGQITLAKPATKVLVGLPYTSTILPMKFDFDLRDGPTRGRKKRINRVEVSLFKSLGGEASTDGQEWLWIYPRDFDDPMDASPPPFSGDAEVVVAGDYSDDSDLYLRQRLPYPMTVRALVVKLDAYGD